MTPVVTRKGITLTHKQWAVIGQRARMVTNTLELPIVSIRVKKLKLALGRNIYVTISSFNDKLHEVQQRSFCRGNTYQCEEVIQRKLEIQARKTDTSVNLPSKPNFVFTAASTRTDM